MTKRLIPTLAAVALLALPVGADAKGNGHKQFKSNGASSAAAGGCPPGLAKKSPSCVPPGLAKKAAPSVGDRLDGDGFGTRYVLVRDPGQYGLDPYGTYYRIAGNVYQVDRETRDILALIGAVSRVLN